MHAMNERPLNVRMVNPKAKAKAKMKAVHGARGPKSSSVCLAPRAEDAN